VGHSKETLVPSPGKYRFERLYNRGGRGMLAGDRGLDFCTGSYRSGAVKPVNCLSAASFYRPAQQRLEPVGNSIGFIASMHRPDSSNNNPADIGALACLHVQALKYSFS